MNAPKHFQDRKDRKEIKHALVKTDQNGELLKTVSNVNVIPKTKCSKNIQLEPIQIYSTNKLFQNNEQTNHTSDRKAELITQFPNSN